MAYSGHRGGIGYSLILFEYLRAKKKGWKVRQKYEKIMTRMDFLTKHVMGLGIEKFQSRGYIYENDILFQKWGRTSILC